MVNNKKKHIKLSEEAKEKIKGLDDLLNEAEEDLPLLKDIGFDTSDIEARLKQARKVRDILLTRF